MPGSTAVERILIALNKLILFNYIILYIFMRICPTRKGLWRGKYVIILTSKVGVFHKPCVIYIIT